MRLRCCTLLRRLDNLLLYSPTPYRLPATVPSYAVSTTCYCTLLRHPTVPRLLRQTADAVQRQQRSQTAARLALPELDEIDFGEADGMEVRKARATMGSVYFQVPFWLFFLFFSFLFLFLFCVCRAVFSSVFWGGGERPFVRVCPQVQGRKPRGVQINCQRPASQYKLSQERDVLCLIFGWGGCHVEQWIAGRKDARAPVAP